MIARSTQTESPGLYVPWAIFRRNVPKLRNFAHPSPYDDKLFFAPFTTGFHTLMCLNELV